MLHALQIGSGTFPNQKKLSSNQSVPGSDKFYPSGNDDISPTLGKKIIFKSAFKRGYLSYQEGIGG